MNMAMVSSFAQLFTVLVNKLPDIIQAFKGGSGKVRQEDAKVLEMLRTIEKQNAQTAEAVEQMQETLLILLQRLDDTPRSSSAEERRTREEVSSELRNLLAGAGISPQDLTSMRDGLGATAYDRHFEEPSREQPRDNMSTQERSDPSSLDKQVFSCEVCTEIYDRGERLPLILTYCGHTFCRKCLAKINLKRRFKCPSCRQEKDQFKDLPTNFALLNIMEGANLTEVTKQPQSEDDRDGSEMSYDDQLALALHISSQEAEKEEYKRLTSELLHGLEEDRRGREVLEEEEEEECKFLTNKLLRRVDGDEDLDEEENQCRGFGATYDDEVEMLDEMNTHREWEEEKKKKEKRRKRRKIREQEELEMALALSLSIQDGDAKHSNE